MLSGSYKLLSHFLRKPGADVPLIFPAGSFPYPQPGVPLVSWRHHFLFSECRRCYDQWSGNPHFGVGFIMGKCKCVGTILVASPELFGFLSSPPWCQMFSQDPCQTRGGLLCTLWGFTSLGSPGCTSSLLGQKSATSVRHYPFPCHCGQWIPFLKYIAWW